MRVAILIPASFVRGARVAAVAALTMAISLIPSGLVRETAPAYQLRGQYVVTAYCSCKLCCGKSDGITASGVKAGPFTVAADRSLPFGTILHLEGLGEYRVEDRGRAIRGARLDVFMHSHKAALAFARRKLYVRVVKFGGA